MPHVQEFVNWWCDLLGVVDPVSIRSPAVLSLAVVSCLSLSISRWCFYTFFQLRAVANTTRPFPRS
jgi:hypothetical protein